MEINKKVIIKKNPNGDTRTAAKNVSFSDFQEANDMHIKDVRSTMTILASYLRQKGIEHDWTKKEKEKEFYEDFLSTMNDGTNFVEGDWYQYHIKEERHHLTSRCPIDVNLFDVIEMITDCVCAGKARSGKIRNLEIDDKMLKDAMKNTVELISKIVVVEGEDEDE